MKKYQYIIIIILFFAVSTAWSMTNPPNANIDYAFAYLPADSALIMHGGWCGPDWQPGTNVWSLQNIGWFQLPSANAPAMMHHCATLDTDRNVIIFCGRQKYPNAGTNVTWEFNGTIWTKKSDLVSDLDGDVEIAYDSNRKKTVAYVAKTPSVETWEYDGTNWNKITTPTDPQAIDDGALMQFDPVSNNVVLLTSGDLWSTNDPAKTWTYDGVDWTLRVAGYPTNAILGGMAFDAARGNMVLITTDSETWTWNGADWTYIQPMQTPTPARGFFTMAYDPTRQVCSFFSGEYTTGSYTMVHPIDTWDWDGTEWSEFVPIPEPGIFIIYNLLFIIYYLRKLKSEI